MGWAVVPLGELIRHRKEFITIQPHQTYSRCRVQTSARGIVLRDRVPSSTIKTKKQQVCRAGEFLVAEIDAKMGGYGIIPEELDGAIVSGHYFLFDVDERCLLQRFLHWYCQTSDFFEQVNARGSTNYAAIRPYDVLTYKVPLPSLAEQRRIVAKLDLVAGLVAEAQKLHKDIDWDRSFLIQSVHFKLADISERPFGDFMELWEERVSVEPTERYPQVGVRGFGGGLFFKDAVCGSETTYKTFNRLRERLLVVSQPKGWEGAVAVCDGSHQDWYVSPEYRTFRCKPDMLDAQYLAALILTPWFQSQLTKLTRGQGARRQRLRPEMLLAMKIRMPTLEAQKAALQLFGRLWDLEVLHTHMEEDVDTILPSMLHGIFHDENSPVLDPDYSVREQQRCGRT